VIDREALRDIPLGYLISLLEARTQHRDIQSARLPRRPVGGFGRMVRVVRRAG
jgi:hypothetical protein